MLSGGPGPAAATLQKLDDQGNLLWSKNYGGNGFDSFEALLQTSDGGFLAAGFATSFSAGGDDDFYVLKADADGTVEWSTSHGGTGGENAAALAPASDGGYVVVGQTNSYSTGASNDVYLVKLSSTGIFEWGRAYGTASENDFARDVQPTSDGGYIICGSGSGVAGSLDALLIRTDVNGDTLWTRKFGGPELDHGNSVRETSDGGFQICQAALNRVEVRFRNRLNRYRAGFDCRGYARCACPGVVRRLAR